LGVLLRDPVSWISNTSQKKWVLEHQGDDLSNYSFAYRQVMYAPKIEWDQRDEVGFFINSDWPDIPRISHSSYYGRHGGIRVGEPLQFPDSFEASFERYHQLSDEEKALFQRSAYWLATCSEVCQESYSLAYVSLVYALEGLLPNPKKTGQCQVCGKDQFDKSVSERFREFLEEYGVGLAKEEISEMYRLRSAIAHGGGLMPHDREVTAFRFTADQNEKDALVRSMWHLCEVILINWLLSDNRAIDARCDTE
jgi:hypothetical protein